MFKYFAGASLALMALLVARIVYPELERLWEPRPYTRVEVAHAKVADGRLQVIAYFFKNDGCKRLSLDDGGFALVGVSGRVTDYLTFSDLDGLDEDHSREEGAQTLRISIDLEGRPWEFVELRTRHDCGGHRPVSRLFARIPLE